MTKQDISNLIYDTFDYIYCNNCRYADMDNFYYHCEDCHRVWRVQYATNQRQG